MSDPEGVWSELARPPLGLSGRVHPANEDVWLAIDSDGRRHLLVRASTSSAGEILLATRGLRATTERLSVEHEPEEVWADVACLDPSFNPTFVAVADDLARGVTSNAASPIEAVRQTLRAWRWFWDADPGALSAEAAIGLFGELWFLERWAPFPESVGSWTGPEGNRYDFTSHAISVEVKATRAHSQGALRHRINGLDQLAVPETGDLYLFSIQAIDDQNAANSLPGLVARIRHRLLDRPDLLGLFDQRLGQAGWSPAHAERHAQTVRVIAEGLYRVDEAFPRLTRDSFALGVPVGVDEVTYVVDLAACERWLVARQPGQVTTLLAGLGQRPP